MEKSETKDNAQQHEDIALKLSTQFFAQELLPYFGIEGKVVGIAPTEEVQIETVIYAMADKFLSELEIEDVREMMKMTKLGELLMREGRIETKIDIITKKLAKGKSIAEIADALEETEEVVENLIKEYNICILL